MGRWTNREEMIITLQQCSRKVHGKKLVNTPATASTTLCTHALNEEDKARAMIIVAMTIMMIH